MSGEVLFQPESVGDIIRSINHRAHMAVEQLKDGEILNTPEGEICATILDRVVPAPVTLHDDEIKLKEQEPYTRDKGQHVVRYAIEIPFEGSRSLFSYCPSASTQHVVRAHIGSDKLTVQYERPANREHGEELRKEIDRDVAYIGACVKQLREDLKSLHESLSGIIREAVRARKTRVETMRKSLEGLGLPLDEGE